MRGCWRLLPVLLCACKAEIGVSQNSADPDAPAAIDAAIDAPVDAVGTFGPWSTPVKIPGADTPANEDDGTLSNSKLEFVFALSDPAIDGGRKHLYWMMRPSVTSMQWSPRMRLPFNLDGTNDETPRFSADDRTLYFGSNRPGGLGGLDIWMVTRNTVGQGTAWNTPQLVTGPNSAATDKWCMPCDGGRYLVISSRAPGTNDDVWEGVGTAAPSRVTQLSSDTNGDTGAFLMSDCMTAYFASTRINNTNRIFKATRTTPGGTWGAPVPFDDFLATIGGGQSDPWMSADQKTFVFASNVSGSLDMYITTR